VYTVTLYDLRTWKEVDVIVDERLPVRTDGSGRLFGAKPSKDGELWISYLEKAIVAHCGGWDQIEGGQCTHAWALLTGNKHQYIIQRSMADPDLFCCTARYNVEQQQWAEHDNAPSGGHAGIWEVPWPELGGGGDDPLDDDELFSRMCTWSDSNYLVAASTKGASDDNTTNGVVDNHAYAVVEVFDDVSGTRIDLILVRNPWGR
jgi:Calpain family cysteine protease